MTVKIESDIIMRCPDCSSKEVIYLTEFDTWKCQDCEEIFLND